MPDRFADPATVRTVLILKPSSLGDIVHTLPVVALLKQAMPDVRFRWLVNPEWAPLLEGNPDIDEVIIFPRRDLGGLHRIGRQLAWLRKLRGRYRSDWVLDFQGLLRSAIIGRTCRGKRFLGLSDAREGASFFYDESAPVSSAPHAIDRYLRLARLVGVEAPTDAPLPCRLPDGTAPAGFPFAPDAPYLLLHPYSRGEGKSLSDSDIETFCRTVGVPVIIAGKADGVRVPELPNVTNLLNTTTLPELIWLLRRASWVVSVDSGPMHIAAGLGRPLVAIHTWSDPAKVGPYHPDAWILKEGQLYQRKAPEERLPAPDIASLARFVSDRFTSRRAPL